MTSLTTPPIDVPDVTLRRASDADIESLVTMINAAYRKGESHVFPGTDRTERHDMFKILSEITVAEVDGTVAACIHITVAPPDAHFGPLAADVTRHGSGLGSMLIAHSEQQAWAAGCTRMRIEVVEEGGRVPYYERRGYRVTQRHLGQEWNKGADWGAAIEWHMVEMEKLLS